ncbi:hypothetical protein ADU72_0718 [Pediococcus damnosus]|uniref:Uncharacterized protein n=1 Tax=Pediococcus damnosus TaxID=51663 RepID=A0ABN4NB42_9LACO|nr:hypothetical protein [Pediococcus damnosus]AMV60843.1 hypothetical protein ADU69_1184 [Pediococcus damnosus]AMV65153.1 hypothetical protein ADU71_1257 [Pediococcus damnosus]AMV66663.1 hypothetical protein ADU72_0718 [Pediococcus damnosus]AMV69960.1 hypothetical protein ADU73_1568 [Pediococcus damnosus]KJU74464.1 hypothetical protein AH70_06440 [Pediococcus damnosus LMG 28219]
MASEVVLFNPGDSLGNFHDYNEAVRSGQLYKHKDNTPHELVIATDPKSDEDYLIFYAKDAVDPKTKNNHGTQYTISKHL